MNSKEELLFKSIEDFSFNIYKRYDTPPLFWFYEVPMSLKEKLIERFDFIKEYENPVLKMLKERDEFDMAINKYGVYFLFRFYVEK